MIQEAGKLVLKEQNRSSSWSLRYSERRMLLSLVDLLLINGAMIGSILLAMARYREDPPTTTNYLVWCGVLSLLWLIVSQIFDINRLDRAVEPLQSAWSAGGIALLVAVLYGFIPLVTPGIIRRLQPALFVILATSSIVVWRLIFANLFRQATFARRMLIVGAGRSADGLIKALQIAPIGMGHQILGIIDDNPDKQDSDIDTIPVLGNSDQLVEWVTKLQIDELVIAISNRYDIRKELFRAIMDIREMGVHVTTMTDVYENLLGKVPVAYAGGDVRVALPTERSASHRVYLWVQRLLDIVMGLTGGVILLLIIPFVWLGNQLTDPGTIFYLQERIGLGGKRFKVIKFRSMVMDAEKFSGAVWAEDNDPRITLMGKFLRKTRLDELPQLWNVLKGEMSMVGPRPERPYFVDQLAELIPFYRARHAVKPGITGWAQVNYGYGASVDDSLVKLEYDLYYIKHQNLYLDFLTIIKTVQVVFGMRGR